MPFGPRHRGAPMRRIATRLRNERPADDQGPVTAPLDDGHWGFRAVDGLPDLEAAPPYQGTPQAHDGPLPLSTGATATGFDDEIKDELASIERRARHLLAGRSGNGAPRRRRELSAYEVALCDAMTARRDAAIHLRQVLADDVDQYECGMAGVRAGLAMDMLVPGVGGAARRNVTEVMSDFEAARHRFRLALVAVAVDNGMTAAQIGQAFAFSRQLASRYLKEARERWPELTDRSPAGLPVD